MLLSSETLLDIKPLLDEFPDELPDDVRELELVEETELVSEDIAPTFDFRAACFFLNAMMVAAFR